MTTNTIIVKITGKDFYKAVGNAKKMNGQFRPTIERDGVTYTNVWEIPVTGMRHAINGPALYGFTVVSEPATNPYKTV